MSGPFGSSQFMYATGAAEEGQSLRFEDGDSAYLSWTPASAGNRKTWTWSGWVKRGNLGGVRYLFAAGNATPWAGVIFSDDGTNSRLQVSFTAGSSAGLATTAEFRDVSAWYHVVASVDTTQAVTADRVKLYVNGSQISAFSTSNYPALNFDTQINNNIPHTVGRNPTAASDYYDGYLANVTFIDGQALTPTSFGEYDDTLWKPKSDADITSLTFGTNGFYLPFKQTTEAEGFSTVTYTGNGGTQSIEGVGFEPDFVWIKTRDTAFSHYLLDSVRGATKLLQSDSTGTEATFTDSLTSFDSSGFSLGGRTGVNQSGKKHVAWCWDAGSGSAVSNTDGSITSSVKANTAKGFSITSYVGSGNASDTVGHSLSSAPDLIILKNRDTARNWTVYNSASGATKFLHLNTTNGDQTSAGPWNDTAPTSSVFSIGTSDNVNKSGDNYVAYCFHSVSGYSSIGSYSGSGAIGNSITGLGFKPAFVMIKRTDSAGNWVVRDNTRSPVNPADDRLFWNLNNSTGSAFDMDFDSDGFTINTTTSDENASGGTYIYMAFADTRDATFFGDTSGNGNNWTPNALNNTDVVPDSPVSGGNFCTLNPVTNSGGTFTEGNLQFTGGSSTRKYLGTTGVSTGKWYWEVKILNAPEARSSTSQYNSFGFSLASSVNVTAMTGDTEALTFADSGYYRNFSGSWTDGGTTITSGDILACAVDLDAGTFAFKRNNTDIVTGNIDSTADGKVLSPHQASYSGTYGKMFCNFGQDSSFAGNETPQGNTDDNGVGDFYYAPPSGFLALTTGNLPTPTITAPDDYFNTVLYTGTSATRSVTGVGFQPDWLWTKARSNASNHSIVDVVRGTNKLLLADRTDSEYTQTIIDSFDSDGFTTSSASSAINLSGYTYVAWNWLAGGTAVSNTDGAMTSSVSANTDAGFSIIDCTTTAANSTCGHGLSKKPELVIAKQRDGTSNWYVLTDIIDGSSDYLRLDLTAAKTDYASSAPTATTITLPFASGVSTISYAFHSVESYSKIGTYTGNGSTDGTFVHLGFRPSFVLLKVSSATENWVIFDNERSEHNLSQLGLYPNTSGAEVTISTNGIDMLSNGFKLKGTGSRTNGSGRTYIFYAVAEAPFKSANAR